MKKNGMRPVPPGEIFNEEFLKPLGLTANALAKAIGVPPNLVTAVLKDERGITGNTATLITRSESNLIMCRRARMMTGRLVD